MSEFCINEPLVTHFLKAGSKEVSKWATPFIFGYFEVLDYKLWLQLPMCLLHYLEL